MPILITKKFVNPETSEESVSTYQVSCLNCMVKDFLFTRTFLSRFGNVRFEEETNGFTAYLKKEKQEEVLIGEFHIFFIE